MSRRFSSILYWILSLGAFGQSGPVIEWQRSLGGSGSEYARSVQGSDDGGYWIAGHTDSNDGDVTGSFGGNDYWVVKVDAAGGIVWQKVLGGSATDVAQSIALTSDGGSIVAGYSHSTNGDVSGNHGISDVWVVKLSADGIVQWKRCYGGSANDEAYTIALASDGGYIVAGTTLSSDGDITMNQGVFDFWLLKIDDSGELEWQRTYGGPGLEKAYSIGLTADGGYVMVGTSGANGGDVTGHHGDADYWVVKVDSVGTLQWQRCLGGSGYDQPRSVLQTSDGGYIIAGESSSSNGDVTDPRGSTDYWIVKLLSDGSLDWQRSLGGSVVDRAQSVLETDDGSYVVAGGAASVDGDVANNLGNGDSWLLKLASDGTIIWQASYGGSSSDLAYSICRSNEGSFVFAGFTNSTDGHVSGNQGAFDVWVVKLGSEPTSVHEIGTDPVFLISPNPASTDVAITFSSTPDDRVQLQLYNSAGQQVAILMDERRPAGIQTTNIQLGQFSAGTYKLILVVGGRVISRELVIIR